MADQIDWKKLSEPFGSYDIEWRAARCGIAKNGKQWVMVLAYVTNRAIMERLDAVIGPAHWRNEYKTGPDGGVLCGLSIRVDGEWITKWDGAENTQFEKIKGGLSGAMKRAAVQWGIGRYLYHLTENFAEVVDKKGPNVHTSKHVDDKTKKVTYILWLPPRLPGWALPQGQDDTGSARSIDFENEAPPAEVVVDDKQTATKPEPSGSEPVSPEQHSAWIEAIEELKSYSQLVDLEKVITAESTIMDDESRLTLMRQIFTRAKSVMPRSDKESQNKLIQRIKIYADRYSWMPNEEANQIIDILRASWS